MRKALYRGRGRVALLAAVLMWVGVAGALWMSAEAEVIPVSSRAQPVDYVLLIDNSASIRRPIDRAIIRETAKLFIDMTEDQDRFSIVLFGEGAHLGFVETLVSEEARAKARAQVDTAIDFRDMLSDHRAALALLDEQWDELFRPDEALPVVIMLSDGKLEPVGNTAEEAYEEMRTLLRGRVGGARFFSVGLGVDEIYHVFMRSPEMIGETLMRDVLADTRNQYYHAESMDDIFACYLEILKQTKNISDLVMEEGVFKVDESVFGVNLVVRKQCETGEVLCRSEDLVLQGPDGQEINALSAPRAYADADGDVQIVWRGESAFYELILIRNPLPGIWRLSQQSGEALEALGVISARVTLEHAMQPEYFLDTPIEWRAWLYDDRTQSNAAGNFELLAEFAPYEEFDEDVGFQRMRRTDGDVYVLLCPQDLEYEIPPGQYSLRISALNRDDEFFFRRSPMFTVRIMEPFFSFAPPDQEEYWLLPGHTPQVALQLTLNPASESYPEGALPPETVCIMRMDGEERRIELVEAPEQPETAFASRHALDQPGEYTYHYRLAMPFPNRADLVVESLPFTFTVRHWSEQDANALTLAPLESDTMWIGPWSNPRIALRAAMSVDPASLPPGADALMAVCVIENAADAASLEIALALTAPGPPQAFESDHEFTTPGVYTITARAEIGLADHAPLQFVSDSARLTIRSWRELLVWIITAIVAILVACALYAWRCARLKHITIQGSFTICNHDDGDEKAGSFSVTGKRRVFITSSQAPQNVPAPLRSLTEARVHIAARPTWTLKKRYFVGAQGRPVTCNGKVLAGETIIAGMMRITFESDSKSCEIRLK